MSTAPSQPALVSAYIPCYNNAKTIRLAIESIRRQTRPVDELFVVDDGSTDNSVELAEAAGVRVIRMEKNQGRGAVRHRATLESLHEFILCCDATNELCPTFLEGALKWFSTAEVLGVFGKVYDRQLRTAVDRWRARHLFKQDIAQEAEGDAFFSTYGGVVRKSSALAVGNFNPALRHGEDFDLGSRLLNVGNVIFDPTLEVQPVNRNTLYEVMERYTRWNRASLETYSLTAFFDSHVVAWKILMPRDLKDQDWSAAAISATMPYFSWALADKRSLTFPPRNPVQVTAQAKGGSRCRSLPVSEAAPETSDRPS